MSKSPVPASLTNIEVKPVPEEQPRRADISGPPARAGRVALTLRIEPELHRRLRLRAFQEDRTIQDIIVDALAKLGV